MKYASITMARELPCNVPRAAFRGFGATREYSQIVPTPFKSGPGADHDCFEPAVWDSLSSAYPSGSQSQCWAIQGEPGADAAEETKWGWSSLCLPVGGCGLNGLGGHISQLVGVRHEKLPCYGHGNGEKGKAKG